MRATTADASLRTYYPCPEEGHRLPDEDHLMVDLWIFVFFCIFLHLLLPCPIHLMITILIILIPPWMLDDGCGDEDRGERQPAIRFD